MPLVRELHSPECGFPAFWRTQRHLQLNLEHHQNWSSPKMRHEAEGRNTNLH